MHNAIRQADNICLEDNTERSESNPGRSLGIYKREGRGCLEDSTYLITLVLIASRTGGIHHRKVPERKKQKSADSHVTLRSAVEYCG